MKKIFLVLGLARLISSVLMSYKLSAPSLVESLLEITDFYSEPSNEFFGSAIHPVLQNIPLNQSKVLLTEYQLGRTLSKRGTTNIAEFFKNANRHLQR